jgi:hypothetical protein
MATAKMKCAAAGLVALTMFGLGSGCAGSVSVEDYVSRVFDIQCERIYACCTDAEQRALSLGDGESGCREALRSAEPAIDGALNDAIHFQDIDFDGTEAKSCLDTLATSSCEWYFGSTPHECDVFTWRTIPGQKPIQGIDSVGLNHFIAQCPLDHCLEKKIVPACNGTMVGK